MSQIAQQLDKVRQRIASAARQAQRQVDGIQLLAVSKSQPVEAILDAFNASQNCFGESYVQEAITKMKAITDRIGQHRIEWHFIGPIQSNKTAAIAEHFSWVHSIDRLKIAQRLNEQRPADLPPLNVCLQVNISGEDSKSGINPEDTLDLAGQIARLPRLQLRGLMTIPAPATDIARQRAPFHRLAQLQQNLIEHDIPVDCLSMGMSSDLEAAILEGATLVRVGTDIFGSRQQRT